MSGFTVKIEKTSETLDHVTALIDDSTIDLVIEAVASKYGWSESLGMSKARFFSYQVRLWATEVVKAYTVEMATKQAANSASISVDQLASTITFQENT